MARFNVKVNGLDSISKKFAQAPDTMTIQAANIIYETAKQIENRAKSRVAVDTGALRSSIRATKLSNGSSMIKAGLPNVSNAKGHLINYAAFVEFGTGRAPMLSYKRLDNSSLTAYAGEFKRSGLHKVIRTPGPYLFNSADELIGGMVEKIKKIKI
jgi:HK97 gp10 family phage protein